MPTRGRARRPRGRDELDEEGHRRMGRVAAVIVTYSRLAKLETVLASVDAQTARPEWIVVVDNASTDGTGAYLAGRDDIAGFVVLSLPTNTGGAGGFSAG